MKRMFLLIAAISLAAIPFVAPAVEPEGFVCTDGEFHPYYEPTVEDVGNVPECLQAAPDCVAVPPELVSTVPNQEWETGFGQALALNYGLHKGERNSATEELVLADIRKEFGLQIDYCSLCGELTMDSIGDIPLCLMCHEEMEAMPCFEHEESMLDCGCWKE